MAKLNYLCKSLAKLDPGSYIPNYWFIGGGGGYFMLNFPTHILPFSMQAANISAIFDGIVKEELCFFAQNFFSMFKQDD